MKCFTNYARFAPDTVNGYKIVITQTYTSFDEAEINALEQNLKQTIGSGIMVESEAQDADDADTETWNGYHGQVTAPKGTFKRIYAEADGGDAE